MNASGSRIHPAAIVDPRARLAADVEIGPWCRVDGDVSLAAGVRLLSHVVVTGHTEIGAGTTVHPFAYLGGPPQHNGYKGEPTRLIVGENNTIREHVTFHVGTVQGGGETRIGDNNLFMVGAHVGHDCIVGSRTTFANNATLGGHCVIGDGVFMGGLSAVHQFSRIGQGAIVGGGGIITRDVIPYGSVWGNHARLRGLNMIGLKRRGFDREKIRRMMGFYRDLFEGDGEFSARLDAAEALTGDLAEAAEIIAFIREGGSRPLCLPEV